MTGLDLPTTGRDAVTDGYLGRVRTLGRGVAVTTAMAVALLGCGDDAEGGPPPATASCDSVQFPQVQFGSHLLGDSDPPVPYSSTPPTSGWHNSGAVPEGIFTEPLPEPAQVSVLEAGGVVVTHHDLAEDDVSRLHELVEGSYADRVVVTSYDAIPAGGMAFTSWGAMQVCDGPDLDAMVAYVEAYASPIEGHE